MYIIDLDKNLNHFKLADRVKKLDEYSAWCEECISESGWSLWEFTSGPTTVIFKFENDYNAFKLRFGV